MTTTAEPTTLRPIDRDAREALFTSARTINTFADTPVTDQELTDVWELARWAPTAANFQPLRVTYVRTLEGQQKLASFMAEGNQEKTAAAPAVAILSADHGFFEHIPTILPFRAELKDVFAANPEMAAAAATNNSWLQAGYFILAVRAMGLAAGPMGGFDAAAIDAEFLDEGRHTVMVVNIGHPGEGAWRDRLPRLDHSDVIGWA